MGFTPSTNTLLVIGGTILILLILQRILYNVGFEIDSIRFLGLSGISIKTKPFTLKIHSLYLEFFKHGKWITITLFQPNCQLKLSNNSRSRDDSRPKEDLKDILARLSVYKSVLVWFNIPWILRRFALSIDQISVNIYKEEKKLWTLKIQRALITFAIDRQSRKQIYFKCDVGVQGFEILDALKSNELLLFKSNVSIHIQKDLQQELILLPEFKIHIYDTIVHTLPIKDSLEHLKPKETLSVKSLDIPIGFIGELTSQFWTLISTFHPQVSLSLSHIIINHQIRDGVEFHLKLVQFELTGKVHSPQVESLDIYAHLLQAELELSLFEKNYNLLYIDKMDMSLVLKTPSDKWTSQLETTTLILNLYNSKIGLSDVLLLNQHVFKSFKLGKKQEEEIMHVLSEQSLRMKPILREIYQLFSLHVQVQIHNLSIYLSALAYDKTDSSSLFIKIGNGNINVRSTTIESLNQSTCRILLGDVAFTNIHMGILHHTDLLDIFHANANESALVKLDLGLIPSGKFNCDLSIQESEESNYISRLLYVFIQGSIDSVQLSLTDIRDDSAQPRYRLLAIYLESLVKKLPKKHKTHAPLAPLVIDTSIECALVRIDCKSDLPATGVRLDCRDLNIKCKFLFKTENLECKFQIGTCTIISFLSNKASETFRSTKNILLKAQGINGVLTRVGLELPNVQVQIDHGQFNQSLVDVYVCIISLQHVLRIFKAIQNKDKARPLAKVKASIRIDRFDCKLNLGHEVLLKLHIYPFKILIQEQSIHLSVEDLGAGVMVESQSHRFESIGQIKGFEFIFSKALVITQGESPFTMSAEAQSLHVNVPHDYRLEHVFENMIDMSKGIKELAVQYLEFVPDPYCKDGNTRIDPSDIPIIQASIQKIVLTIQDDPFEFRLGQNYHKGFEEQAGRISRDKAFEKQASLRKEAFMKSMEKDSTMMIEDGQEVAKAYELLQEFNSRSWIENITKSKAKEKEHSLLMGLAHSLVLRLDPPSLPRDTVELSLNEIDHTTPGNLVYLELIARNLHATLSDLVVTLRDYPHPLVSIPKGPDSKTWTLEGLLVIVNNLMQPQSVRPVDLDLKPLPLPPIRVYRAVDPVKIYLNSKSIIHTDKSIRVTYGASMEPCLSDMIRMLDTFTKETIDPSPPIGWWDKLRFMLHGQNSLKIVGGGELRMRILGSFSPYFDSRKHSGTEGVDIVLNQGVRLDLGGDPYEGKDAVIQAGQVTIGIPHSHIQSDMDKSQIITRFKGGVTIAVGLSFLTDPTKLPDRKTRIIRRHCDVNLVNPDFCLPGEQDRDSYFGFRTLNIFLTLNITTPNLMFSGLSHPLNSLYLTLKYLNSLSVLAQVYQSVLTNQSIRSGKLFNITSIKEKPKLGLMIKSIRIQAKAHPLILGFMAETEDLDGAVGVRCRSEQMTVDLRINQRHIQKVQKDIPNPLKRKSVSKWILKESAVDFLELEMRSFSYGFDDRPNENSFKNDAEALNWIIDEDFYYANDIDRINLDPFITSPRLSYFKRHKDNKKAGEQDHLERIGVYKVQIQLFQQRLREIEASIWRCLKVQQNIENRLANQFDSTLKRKSEQIVEQLTILHEKKHVLDSYIRKCELKLSLEERNTSYNDTSPFKHCITLHNVNFLWKAYVRNVIFKLFDLIQRNSDLKFCISYGAVRLISQMIRKATFDSPKKREGSFVSNPTAENDKDNPRYLLDHLLETLLADLRSNTRLYVPNERMEESKEEYESDSLLFRRMSSMIPETKYKPSKDPNAPDFIRPSQLAEGHLLIQLINPQVNFESFTKVEEETIKQSVLVTASSIQFKAVSIIDKSASKMVEDRDKTIDLVKTRHIYSVLGAQFFIVKNVHESEDVFSPTTVLKTADFQIWPYWVPIECLLDQSSDTGILERVVDNTSVLIHRDKHNPLYVKKQGSRDNDTSEDTLHIAFPDFQTSLSSDQFLVISDTISNLLIYKDPRRTKRYEQLKKMVLVLDQSKDISKVLDSVLNFQEKIKKADTLLKSENHLTSSEYEDICKCLVLYQDELYVLLEAFKSTIDLESKKKSLLVNSKFTIFISKLVWCMTDSNIEFCRLTLNQPKYENVSFEDSSSSNTVEIDSLQIENTGSLPSQFKEILSPYIPDRLPVDFNRNKMLRVYWKEIPPVAGIQVFHHFEINMFPLFIQMTFDVGKQFMYYFFPAKRVSRPTDGTDSQKYETSSSSLGGTSKSKSVVASSHSSLKTIMEADHDIKLMQTRATQNKSFIYIKVPGVEHCISYKGSKEKNLEDLYMFPFLMPTLEYRNKTWSWLDFIESLKRDAFRVIFANTGALVREKIFQKRKVLPLAVEDESDTESVSASTHSVRTEKSTDKTYSNEKFKDDKSKKSRFPALFTKKKSSSSLMNELQNDSLKLNHMRSISEGTGKKEYDVHAFNGDGEYVKDYIEKSRILFGKFYPNEV